MFKIEITKNDIETTISKAIGERVVIIEDKDEQGNNRIQINKLNKETDRYTINLYTITSRTAGDIRKKLILDLISNAEMFNVPNIVYVNQADLKKKKK